MGDNEGYDRSPVSDHAPSPQSANNGVPSTLTPAPDPRRSSTPTAVPPKGGRLEAVRGSAGGGPVVSRDGKRGSWTNPGIVPDSPRGSVDANGRPSPGSPSFRLTEPEDENVKLSQFGRKGKWNPPEGEQSPSYRRPKPTLFDKKDPDLSLLTSSNRSASYRSSLRSNDSTASHPASVKSFTSVVDETDLDRLSQYSLYMVKETPIQRFRYYFQHPYARLFIAYFVTFCNFLIYAEDPVAHSMMECKIPVIGQVFAFVCTKYPPNAWSLLKVWLWLLSLAAGMIVGKLLVHKLLLARLFRLKMFTKDRGSWMVMFFTSIISLFIGSWIYNLFLLASSADMQDQYWISGLMGVSFSWFMKAAACGTWLGDLFTAWMVTDMMLQEKLYPHWAKPVRKWWVAGWHRIILFWAVNLALTIVVVVVITTDYISWDKLNYGFIATSELSRSFLASFILVMDLLIVMQDWDFPHFMNNLDIKLPGVNVAHVDFYLPKCLRKEKWKIHISGKWFNYGIIFFVMLLDLNMWKNQIFYTTEEYGQYLNEGLHIITVRNKTQLEMFNTTEISFDFRNNTINPDTGLTYINEDVYMNSQFYNYRFQVKGLAFLPSLIAFATFGTMIWLFGRFRPSKTDVFAGRLKKKAKHRSPRRNKSNNKPMAPIAESPMHVTVVGGPGGTGGNGYQGSNGNGTVGDHEVVS